MLYLLVFIFGCATMSFFDVIIYRSHSQLAWWQGRSMCPNCHHTLAWYDVIPIVSQLWLKNRCRYCHECLSWHYLIMESMGGGLALYCFSNSYQLTNSTQWLLYVSLLIIATSTWSDWRYFELYPLLFLPLILIWFILWYCTYHTPPALLLPLLVFLIGKQPTIHPYMGEGDFWFMSWLVTFLTLSQFMRLLLIASIIGLCIFLFSDKQTHIPFIPCLSIALIFYTLL